MGDMEGGSESQVVGTGAPSGTLEGGSSSLEARLSKERRRRERRERRARRQQRNSLISQMDGGCIYDQGVHHVPDLLHHHLPPPPAYTTLPGRARPTSCPQRPMPPPQHSWRENLPAFARRSRGCGEEVLMQPEGESKTCCGLAVSQTVSIRWFIVMIAFVGICCSVVGTVLGAMKAQGREHLTVSLLMIGVGIVLVTVSGIAWRLTSQDAPTCRAMLGLGGDERLMPGHTLGGRSHPYAGMIYSEFQYRPPPPSYQASMQEYRLRLLLMERSGGPPPPPPPALSPPPAYRGPGGRGLPQLHGSVSRPPSYHSRQGSSILPLHVRHPSQLSKLSIAGANDTMVEENEEKVNVTQVPVVPHQGHKASIQIQGSHDMEQYISNTQEHFHKVEGKEKEKKRERRESEVTIVQNTSMELHQPVVVTVSGSLDIADSNSNADCDVLAHL